MRHARRLIATLVGVAFWCVAATTVAYAQLPTRPDPGGGVILSPRSLSPRSPITAETPLWKFFAVAALGALMAVAVVGLIASLRHSRTKEPSQMLHA